MNTRVRSFVMAFAGAVALIAPTAALAQIQGEVPPPPSLPAPANSLSADPWPRDMTLSKLEKKQDQFKMRKR